MSQAGMRASWPLAPLVGTLFWRVMIVETAHLEQRESSGKRSKADIAQEGPIKAQLYNTFVLAYLCFFLFFPLLFHLQFVICNTMFRERNYCKNDKTWNYITLLSIKHQYSFECIKVLFNCISHVSTGMLWGRPLKTHYKQDVKCSQVFSFIFFG